MFSGDAINVATRGDLLPVSWEHFLVEG